MYQLMLFKDMLPEYIPSHTETNTDCSEQVFQVCSIDGTGSQFKINIQEGRDPESVALETLGYFVVPEVRFADEAC